MKVAFEKAQRAAIALSEELGSPEWLLGVGVDADAVEGFVLSIRVAPGFATKLQRFARRFKGVLVQVVERQRAKPLHSSRKASS